MPSYTATDAEHYAWLADQWFTTHDSYGGSFVNALFDLCAVADGENRERLRSAFPELVGAWLERKEGPQNP